MAQPAGLTKDGYESQFGTNHMGHALFTKLLLPTLQKTAAEPSSDVRIINVTSIGHRFAPKGGFLPDKATSDMADYSTWARYGQSKLANILFTRELVKRYPEITSLAIHPGAVSTNLSNSFKEEHPYLNVAVGWMLPMLAATAAVGAYNQTWAATAPVTGKTWTEKTDVKKSVVNGSYYTPVAKEGGETNLAKDPALAEKLWDWTEKELASKGY